MRLSQKKRYEKYKGLTIKGFSPPPFTLKGVITSGKIVGYDSDNLIVSCDNSKGWIKENYKYFCWIDELEQLANKNGYWFVSLKEIKESIKHQNK